MLPRLFFCLMCLLLSPALVSAATLTWPGAAPCDASLQSCIDGASNNDVIRIDADLVTVGIKKLWIDRNIKLTIMPAPGRKPVFYQTDILINNADDLAGNFNVTVRDLAFDDCSVQVKRTGTGAGIVELRNLVLDAANDAASAIGLQADGGTLNATLYNNDVRGNAPLAGHGVISLKSYGGTLSAVASFNKVRGTAANPPGAGIMVDIANGSTDSVITLHANEVRGTFQRAGIFLSENGAGGPDVTFTANLFDNVVVPGNTTDATGINAIVHNGKILTNFHNNTVTQANPGIKFSRWGEADTGTFDGMLANNLIRARGPGGVAIRGANAPGLLVNSGNLINGLNVNFSPNANTITDDAKLVSDEFPRLVAGSPAIDAAVTASGVARNAANIPPLDADGMRRSKRGITGGTGPSTDIGAYEYGDAVFAHDATPDTISGATLSWLTHPSVDGLATANLFATPSLYDGVSVSKQFIPWWDESSRWGLYAESTTDPIPFNARFHLLSPADGTGVFRHTTSATPSSNPELDDASVNDKREAFILVSRTSSLSTHVSNPRPFGIVSIFSSGEWRWLVQNLDGTSFPGSTSFSVYAQTRSPNAFVAEVTAGNRNEDNNLVLDHPLLNNMPCALPVLTAVSGSNNFTDQGSYNVYYDESSQRWTIFQLANGGVMPLGARFHVLVNPAQVHACSHPELFSDGFESL